MEEENIEGFDPNTYRYTPQVNVGALKSQFNPQGNKSIAVMWLREKSRHLTQIALAMKPEDSNDEYHLDLFLDLVMIGRALDSALDMVEEMEVLMWEANSKRAEQVQSIHQLMKKVKAYEEQMGKLDENLRIIEE